MNDPIRAYHNVIDRTAYRRRLLAVSVACFALACLFLGGCAAWAR